MKKTKSILVLLLAVFALMAFTPAKKTKAVSTESTITFKTYKKAFNFFVISDWGWSGGKDQQLVQNRLLLSKHITKHLISLSLATGGGVEAKINSW